VFDVVSGQLEARAFIDIVLTFDFWRRTTQCRR